SAQATDDVGVRAVTFFLDRNANGVWDAAVDQPLGDAFQADKDGRYSVVATPDASWPTYPTFARIVADTVDTDGQWATTRAQQQMTFAGRPVISSFFVNTILYSEGQPNPFYGVSLAAKVDEPMVYPYGGTNVTFFLDKNSNGIWDTGIDQ